MTDKDNIRAEIERRIVLYSGLSEETVNPNRIDEDRQILSFIDTLEVKEVDLEHLEQEVKDFCYKFDDRKDKWYDMTPHDQNLMVSPTFANFAMQLAKHFFELGVNVSNPLTWEDIKIILDIENDILRECNSQKELVIKTYPKGEDYYGEILKRFKAQKGE